MKKLSLIASLLGGIASTSHAADADSSFRFLLGGGATVNREVDVTKSDESLARARMKALGVQLYAGVEYRWTDRLSLVNTLGYRVDEVGGTGGTVHLTSIPFDGLALYGITNQIRVGGGVEVAGRPTLAAGTFSARQQYQTSPGLLLQAEYLFTPHMGLALRYVAATYKAKDGGANLDADNAGLAFNYYF